MHGHDIGRVLGGHLGGELRIARPGDDVLAHFDVRVQRIEAIDHRGDDPALPLDLRQIGGRPELGRALAEEALEIDGRLVAAAFGAAPKHQRGEKHERAHHRTAVPAIARTICFWKMM